MVLSIGSHYAGEYQHNLDAKDRLTIPSKWRSANADEVTTYLLLPMSAGYVGVFPKLMMEKLQEKAAEVSLGDSQGRKALRKLFRLADIVKCDSQGRINVNSKLIEHTGIARDAVLVGNFTCFEIWNPETYEAHLNSSDDDDGDEINQILIRLGL